MTRKEAKEKAIEVKKSVTDFNNPSDEIGYDLYEFELDGNNLVVFAYIQKSKRNRWKEMVCRLLRMRI